MGLLLIHKTSPDAHAVACIENVDLEQGEEMKAAMADPEISSILMNMFEVSRLTVRRINRHQIFHGWQQTFRQVQCHKQGIILRPNIQVPGDLTEELS